MVAQHGRGARRIRDQRIGARDLRESGNQIGDAQK
jgi:hypothetical protein